MLQSNNTFLSTLFFLFSTLSFVQAQQVQLKGLPHKIPQGIVLRGEVKNYSKQSLYLYQCGVYPDKGGSDTLLLVDSTVTDVKGKFIFPNFSKVQNFGKVNGMYKVILQRNQSFYILNDGNPIEIKTVYLSNAFYNIATDSLKIITSEENKRFYEFQRLQKHLNVANYFLLQMMRLYPLPDPFHKNIEDEYFKRYKKMEQFVKQQIKERPEGLATKIAKAYYQPDCPDWKQPDTWRDSIIANHYFDYFNPADSFYLHTNILSEKMDMYLTMRTNKADAYGQPLRDENLFSDAATDFLEKTKTPLSNGEGSGVRSFCLNYYLKKFNKEHKENAFLSLYDTYLKTQQGDCGSSQTDEFTWARKKADVLRNVQIGSIAPDFSLQDGKLNLSSIQSDYTLLVFWATWCPHCIEEIPKIKLVIGKIGNQLSVKQKENAPITDYRLPITVLAISLDTDKAAWQKYVQDNNLFTWLNTSELKGWKGEIPKQYNVYAMPTMFLLDKDKKIIAKPENSEQLLQWIDVNNKIQTTKTN